MAEETTPEQIGDSSDSLTLGGVPDVTSQEFLTSDDFLLVPKKKKSKKHPFVITEVVRSVLHNHGDVSLGNRSLDEESGSRNHTGFWKSRCDSTLISGDSVKSESHHHIVKTCQTENVTVNEASYCDKIYEVLGSDRCVDDRPRKELLVLATNNCCNMLHKDLNDTLSDSIQSESKEPAPSFLRPENSLDKNGKPKKRNKKANANSESKQTLEDMEKQPVSMEVNKKDTESSPQEVNCINTGSVSSSESVRNSKKNKKRDRKRKESDEEFEKILKEFRLANTVGSGVTKSIQTQTQLTYVEGKTKDLKNESVKVQLNSQFEEKHQANDNHTMKTANQKRKEKKMKEKQNKLEKHELENGETKSPGDVKMDNVELKPDEESVIMKDQEDPAEKLSREKKGKKENLGVDKNRPRGKQLAIIQEALQRAKEDAERIHKEQEVKQKAAEEAEKVRLEKLRLEQERKDRKKLKEKEKREKLKAEGKLLSKSQKQARARMEATLAALRQQGIDVPKIGEKKPPGFRLGSFKSSFRRTRHDSLQSTDDSSAVSVTRRKTVSLSSQESSGKDSISSSESKDSWDVSPMEGSAGIQEIEGCRLSCSEDSDMLDETSPDSEKSGTGFETVRLISIKPRVKSDEVKSNCIDIHRLRSPVVCVLGHVDTGKTKLLDYIRKTHVQDSEAGHITQQIGATMIPRDALKEKCKMVRNFLSQELKVPGLLVIDTPGHESFSNLRSRGSSICDIAVLVVDIMHGLEQQTIESINLLKKRKTPFIVALNKIDRLYGWKQGKEQDIEDVINNQSSSVQSEFNTRCRKVILQFAEQSLNTVLYYENKDPKSYISMVPSSAVTGDGMGNILSMVVQLTQSMMSKKLTFSEELQATVLEVKAISGLGTTIDVILVNGRLREGDTIIAVGQDGPVVTQIRSLLMPQPLKELRVKNPYKEYKEVEGAQGVKLTGKDLDKVMAGLPLLVAQHPSKIDALKEEINSMFKETINAIRLSERGVYVQASTLGSLEALLDFLQSSAIPYFGVKIGPVVKKDVMKASIMLEHDSQYATILAFDVKIERDAQDLAESLGVKIFQSDIIYHLFDKFIDYRDNLRKKKMDEIKHMAVFPCKLKILPQYVFSVKDPIVLGVTVEAGILKLGTPICVPSRDNLDIGTVSVIEVNHKQIDCAKKGQDVCVKLEPKPGESHHKMYGKHFDESDVLVSRISRQSIDVCKEHFRDVLQSPDWQLIIELKKTFQIL